MNNLGYSDFNNLMGLTSKKLPYIILHNVYLKSFLKDYPFLANLYYKIQKYTHCVLNDPNIYLGYFFACEYPKNAKFYAGFKSV